jgi:predicted permease
MRIRMNRSWYHIRLAVRLIRKDPGSTISILLSLMLGVGLYAASIIIFLSFCNSPVTGVKDPQNLVLIRGNERFGRDDWLPISYPDYKDLAASTHRLSGLAAFQAIRPTLSVSGNAEATGGEAATPDLFKVLGVNPLVGRTLTPEDDEPGAAGALWISYQMWTARFSQGPSVIGRKVLVNGNPCIVVGVLPAEFVGIDALRRPQFWIPISTYDRIASFSDPRNQRGTRTVFLLGRLAPGVSVAQAKEEIRVLSHRLVESYPDAHDDRGIDLVSLRTRVPASGGTALLGSARLLFWLSFLFLLLACGNVTILLLVRALARRREFATRLALGATRRALLSQLLIEGLVLSVLGTVSAALFEFGFLSLLIHLDSNFAQILSEGFARGIQHPELPALLVILVVLACGMMPVAYVLRVEGRSTRGQFAMTPDPSPGARFTGRCLIGLQSLLSTAMLACAGFFVLSFIRLNQIDPGIERNQLLLASLELSATTSRHRVTEELLEELNASSNIHSAAVAENTLLTGFRTWKDLSTIRHPAAGERLLVASDRVSESYFKTIGLQILKGRGFNREDYARASHAAIINEALARRLGGGKVVGGKLFIDNEPEPVEVVGIVRNISFVRADPSLPILYLPFDSDKASRLSLLVRFSGGLSPAAHKLQSVLDQFSTAFTVSEVQTISDVIHRLLWLPRSAAALLSLIALLSLLLAANGIYGVLCYLTRLRKREAMIRAALGASALDLVKALLTRDLAWSLAGSLLGLTVAGIVHRYIQTLLYRPFEGNLAIMATAIVLVLATTLTGGLISVAEIRGHQWRMVCTEE